MHFERCSGSRWECLAQFPCEASLGVAGATLVADVHLCGARRVRLCGATAMAAMAQLPKRISGPQTEDRGQWTGSPSASQKPPAQSSAQSPLPQLQMMHSRALYHTPWLPTYTCSSHGLPGMVTFPCAICGRTQTQHDVCMDSDLQSNIIRLGSRPGVPPLPHAGAHAGGAAEGQSHQRAARQRGKLRHIPTPVEGLRTSPRLGRDVLGPLRAAPQAALQADGTLVSARAWGDTNTPCTLPSLQVPACLSKIAVCLGELGLRE